MPDPELDITKLTEDTAVVPRPAATIVLVRGGAVAIELLMVRRTLTARFMGGAWVFPGGAVDASDGTLGPQAFASAARRELEEEAGIALPAEHELIPYARWITPAGIPIRFDTWFFLASAPLGAEPRIDGGEIIDDRWISPPAALAAGAAGEMLLAFPTRKQLEQLALFRSERALLDHARGREVVTVEPRVLRAEDARIVLPGDPGYDSAKVS